MRAAAVLALIGLVGCSNPVLVVKPPSFQALQTLTAADLQQAISLASSASPPDVEAATCYTFLLGKMDALSGIPKPSGVVSTFELGRLGYMQVENVSPIGNQELEIACGPLALNVIGGAVGLLQQLGVGVSLPVK